MLHFSQDLLHLSVIFEVEGTVVFVGLLTELTTELGGVEDALVIGEIVVNQDLVERMFTVIVGRELLGVLEEVLVLLLNDLLLTHGESLG
jgi:hypothetical protein